MPKYLITVETDPIKGTGMAAAEHQGWGARYLRAYLSKKLPAGSPVKIGAVEQVPQSFHIGFGVHIGFGEEEQQS